MKRNKKKENKVTLKFLWSIPFYNSLIKLGLWILFFIIIYIFLSLGSGSNKRIINNDAKKEEEVSPKISYIDMKKNLIGKELSINYTVKDYIITGLVNNGTLKGVVEDSNSIFKIKYDGEKIYELKKEEELDNNEILSDINLDYLLPTKIIDLVDNPKVIGIKSADELTYSYDVNGVEISIYLNEKAIEKIIVLDGDLTYNLEYKEVVNEK